MSRRPIGKQVLGVLIFTGSAERTLMEEAAFLAEMIEVLEQLARTERPHSYLRSRTERR
jgi:hypothetical protein